MKYPEGTDRNEMEPVDALAECFDLWASGVWDDRNAVYNLEEVMSYVEKIVNAQTYALSDCVNYDTNTQGDCGGRVERVSGVVICETCRNRKPRSTVFDRPEGNVYILPEGTDL